MSKRRPWENLILVPLMLLVVAVVITHVQARNNAPPATLEEAVVQEHPEMIRLMELQTGFIHTLIQETCTCGTDEHEVSHWTGEGAESCAFLAQMAQESYATIHYLREYERYDKGERESPPREAVVPPGIELCAKGE